MTRMSRGVSRNCHPKLALHSLHCTGTYALQPHAAPTSRSKRTERKTASCVRGPVSTGKKQAICDRRYSASTRCLEQNAPAEPIAPFVATSRAEDLVTLCQKVHR